jgi:hypothetical protein
MARFTVHQGKRYRATIKLTGLKRLASNATIAGVLEGAEFAQVSVEGTAEHATPKPCGRRRTRPRRFHPRSSRSKKSRPR